MTMSAPEAHDLALATPPVSREAAEHVLNFLFYHKAMIGESLGSTNLLDR